jgi:uracil phosphoribosyltransferase
MKDYVTLKAEDLAGLLKPQDEEKLAGLEALYSKAEDSFRILSGNPSDKTARREKDKVIALYNEMGRFMRDALASEDAIKVYPFETPRLLHGEASRIIAKLRDAGTGREEFVHYTQRAFEMLFNLAWGVNAGGEKNYRFVRTPVTHPCQQYAVHKMPDVDKDIENTVMCVMLRGALLPSMILSKEIEENSSTEYVTPFALFRIKRNETRRETDMEYVLDLKRSFFRIDDLRGKDLVFADPMNATAGSLVTIVRYLESLDARPRSISVFNIISSFKGALHAVRALPGARIYTLWMDPVLNELAYILPGLGDAGDRLNGRDGEERSRNIMQLLGDYGANILSLYRSQVEEIERVVLG